MAWLLFITVLFFLPGSAFPRETWFSKIYIDKWVHTGFFMVLVFLWRAALDGGNKGYSFLLLILAITYGWIVEIIQKNWVPHRDFDLMDLLFDTVGSLLGLLAWSRVYKKNKPL